MDAKSALLSAFLQYVIPVLATALFLVLKWALLKWSQKLATEDQTTKAVQYWGKLNAIAQTVVLDVEKTVKPALLEATKDGELSKDDYAKLKQSALDALKLYMGESAGKDITGLLGIAAPDVEKFLGGVIESAVSKVPVIIGESRVTNTASNGVVITDPLNNTKPAEAKANP